MKKALLLALILALVLVLEDRLIGAATDWCQEDFESCTYDCSLMGPPSPGCLSACNRARADCYEYWGWF